MGLKTLEEMNPADFRKWCASVGERFNFCHDTDTWFISMSDDELQSFAMDVIEKFGERDE
jgi:hypothetical protein